MDNEGLGTWIARRRVKSEGETAIIAGNTTITYDEFADRIAQCANALAARGVVPGTRVAYLGDNHPDFLTTLFACGAIGAIFVPLNTRLAAGELGFQLKDSGASLLVAHRHHRELAQAATKNTNVRHRLLVDAAADLPNFESYDGALATASAALPSATVTMDDPALILYTSGTTGRPKGAVLTHGNLTWNALNVLVDYDVTSDEVALLIAPMFHVASLSMGALPNLLKGGTLVLHQKFDPAEVLHAIQTHRVTSMSGVPTTYQFLAEHPDWAATDLSTLRKLTCGGSSVPLRVIEAYEARGLSFSSGYGMTETSPGATALPYRKARDHVGSSGLSHFFTEVRIVDESGNVAQPGAAGEIQISGPNVIAEYWNRPDASAAAYDGPWFKSGDIGYVDEDGYLFISDRLKDMIISGGENIYPAEVERYLMEIPEISAAAVIGVPDAKWGEVPLAVVVQSPGNPLTADEVRSHLVSRLAKYKVPKAVVFVDDLPRTASGKIRKVELRERFAQMPASSPS